MLLYQILAYTIHRKILKQFKKSHIRTRNLKYQLRHGIKNLKYLMNLIIYQIYKIVLNIYYKIWAKDF